MKVFKVTTSVETTTIYEYIVEAESRAEAEEIIRSGSERGEGEAVDQEDDWETEVIKKVKFIEDLES